MRGEEGSRGWLVLYLVVGAVAGAGALYSVVWTLVLVLR